MKIILTGCTHRSEHKVKIPKCNLLIHTGDFDCNSQEELENLDAWFSIQPADKCIFVAGNHDFHLQKIGKENIKKTMKNAIYLEDESLEIKGIKFYGFPWVPTLVNWAFYADDKDMEEKVNQIPEGTDILISHGPHYGILDQLRKANGDLGMSVGNIPLRDAIKKRIKPSILVCSHIHEAFGYYYDYQTHFWNVSAMDEFYSLVNEPVLIEVEKIKGKLKIKEIE